MHNIMSMLNANTGCDQIIENWKYPHLCILLLVVVLELLALGFFGDSTEIIVDWGRMSNCRWVGAWGCIYILSMLVANTGRDQIIVNCKYMYLHLCILLVVILVLLAV